MTITTLPSTAGQKVTLRREGSGRTNDSFYYYITPFGSTRTFRTKYAAIMFAKRHKWEIVEEI